MCIGVGSSDGITPHEKRLLHTARRTRRIVLQAMEFAYYIGVLPLKFVQHDYLYYDTTRCASVAVFVLVSSMVMLFAHFLATSFNDIYTQANMIGYWEAREHRYGLGTR